MQPLVKGKGKLQEREVESQPVPESELQVVMSESPEHEDEQELEDTPVPDKPNPSIIPESKQVVKPSSVLSTRDTSVADSSEEHKQKVRSVILVQAFNFHTQYHLPTYHTITSRLFTFRN